MTRPTLLRLALYLSAPLVLLAAVGLPWTVTLSVGAALVGLVMVEARP